MSQAEDKSSQSRAAAAQLELILREERELLESSLKAFIKHFFPIVEGVDFIFKDHHEEIIEALESVYNGEEDRLIINIPPGYGKTELVVVMFSAWCFAKEPRCRFMHLSYADDLVKLNSVKIKAIIESEEFQELWPTQFDRAVNGKGHWKTQKGEFRAVATEGMVTGFRAGRLEDGFFGAIIYDDPIKPEDAMSDHIRKKKNRLTSSTVKNRLMREDTPIIVIMQRVHDDDTTGFLRAGKTGDDFRLINIPAILDLGLPTERALWPEKDSLPYLKRFQTNAPYIFGCQYQGNPVPDEGVFFKRDDFKWYGPGCEVEEIPFGENFGSSDNATTDGAGDFTEQGVFCVTPDNRVFIRDWWGGQTSADVWIEQQMDFATKYDINRWAGETGPIKNATEPFLKRRMVERNKFFTLDYFSHAEASKEQNARGFQALTASGRVWLPIGKQWAIDLVEQLCRFPLGTFDDKVDTCSLFAKMINKLWSEEQVVIDEPPQPQGITIDQMINQNRRSNAKSRKRQRNRL